MDLAKILQKVQLASYDNMEAMQIDVTQMFDNAMTFNEPDSLLYKVKHTDRT